MLKWDACFIFDGCKNEAKEPEYTRREGKLRNESLYIAMAAKVCRDLFVPYIVAKEEADPQAVHCCPSMGESNVPTMIVTGYSDLFAYGAIHFRHFV